MKTLKLLTLLILGFCISISAQIPMGTDLFIVLEKEGDAIIQSTDGRLFDAEPATYLYKGNKLILGKDSYVMLHYGLLTMQLTEEGEYILNDELFEEVLTDGSDFDPLFADFTAFSIEVLVDAIEFGEWDIDRSNKGDGWGSKDKKNIGGWGSKDKINPGGWGSKDKKNIGGWGANDQQSKSGFGIIPPHNSGWGSKDKKNPGGWGSKDKKNIGGWGSKDKKNIGGWGSKSKKNPGGWGTNDPREQGAWGSKDKKNIGGWGFDDMTIETSSPGGFYIPSISSINWLQADSISRCLFIISDMEENLIHSEISTNTQITYDFSLLEKDTQYFWQVFAGERKAISQPVEFVVKSFNQLDNVLRECRSSTNYKSSGPVLKGLMELFVLEKNGYYLQAYKKYSYLLEKYPNNNLVRINYASFSLRMGQFESAKSLAEKL